MTESTKPLDELKRLALEALSDQYTNHRTLDVVKARAVGATSFEDAPWETVGSPKTRSAKTVQDKHVHRVMSFDQLTDEQIKFIRTSRLTVEALAKEFDITQPTMSVWMAKLGCPRQKRKDQRE